MDHHRAEDLGQARERSRLSVERALDRASSAARHSSAQPGYARLCARGYAMRWPLYARSVGPGWKWCSRWADHPEAVLRLTALYVGWREARQTGRMLVYLRDLDAQMRFCLTHRAPSRRAGASTTRRGACPTLPPLGTAG